MKTQSELANAWLLLPGARGFKFHFSYELEQVAAAADRIRSAHFELERANEAARAANLALERSVAKAARLDWTPEEVKEAGL